MATATATRTASRQSARPTSSIAAPRLDIGQDKLYSDAAVNLGRLQLDLKTVDAAIQSFHAEASVRERNRQAALSSDVVGLELLDYARAATESVGPQKTLEELGAERRDLTAKIGLQRRALEAIKDRWARDQWAAHSHRYVEAVAGVREAAEALREALAVEGAVAYGFTGAGVPIHNRCQSPVLFQSGEDFDNPDSCGALTRLIRDIDRSR